MKLFGRKKSCNYIIVSKIKKKIFTSLRCWSTDFMINVIHINKQDRVHLLIFVSMKQATFFIALSRKHKQTKRACENGLPYCLGFKKPCWFLARM